MRQRIKLDQVVVPFGAADVNKVPAVNSDGDLELAPVPSAIALLDIGETVSQYQVRTGRLVTEETIIARKA